MTLLDTNVCVGILHSDPKVASHLAESNDLIAVPGIAATALCRNAVLATGNVKHFERIDGLRIENWFV